MPVKDTEEIIQAQRNPIMFLFLLKDFRSLEGCKNHLEITSRLHKLAHMRTASGLNEMNGLTFRELHLFAFLPRGK